MSDTHAYSVDIFPSRAFLRIAMRGRWDEAVAAAFRAEVAGALRRMIERGAPAGQIRTLVDMRGKTLLTQPVSAMLAAMLHPESPSLRIALIASGALHKAQARRVAAIEKCRVFDQEEAALAWLFDSPAVDVPVLVTTPASSARPPAPPMTGAGAQHA